MCSGIKTAVAEPTRRPADVDDRIAALEDELAALYRRRRDRDHAAILLAILHVTDSWFTARELRALVPLSTSLSAHLTGVSAKALGRRLKAIADAQDQSGAVPALRLLRHKTTTAATVWKIETYPPTSAAPAGGQ